MLVLVLTTLPFLVLSIMDQNYLFALVLFILFVFGAYFTLLALSNGELNREKIVMRQVWGGQFAMEWKEIEEVKFSAAHIKFCGKDKWLTVTLEGIENKNDLIAYVADQIERRKLKTKPLTGLTFFRLFKNCKVT
jgi:hypothetical protein